MKLAALIALPLSACTLGPTVAWHATGQPKFATTGVSILTKTESEASQVRIGDAVLTHVSKKKNETGVARALITKDLSLGLSSDTSNTTTELGRQSVQKFKEGEITKRAATAGEQANEALQINKQ